MKLLIAAALIAAATHVSAFDYKIIYRSSGKKVANFTSDRTPGQMSRALALSRYQAIPIGNISRHYGPWHAPKKTMPPPKREQVK